MRVSRAIPSGSGDVREAQRAAEHLGVRALRRGERHVDELLRGRRVAAFPRQRREVRERRDVERLTPERVAPGALRANRVARLGQHDAELDEERRVLRRARAPVRDRLLRRVQVAARATRPLSST